MASEVASAQPAQIDSVMDSLPESTSFPDSQVNGLDASTEVAANAAGFEENATIPQGEADVSMKDAITAGPSPVNDVTSGIQPTADFLPKDANNLSHPTPPPDEPLASGLADVDTEMANGESNVPAPIIPETAPPSEPSLVRPREDDGDDERAAKRSRVDNDLAEPFESVAPLAEQAPSPSEALPTQNSEIPAMAPAVEDAKQPVQESFTNATIDAPAQPASEPDGAVAPDVDSKPVTTASDVKAESAVPAAEPMDAAAQPTAIAHSAAPTDAAQANAKPAETIGEAQVQLAAAAAAPAAPEVQPAEYSTAPITPAQKTFLIERMKNLKKAKYSVPFLKPVDPVALNIPNYPDIVKNPMDIGTMDRKLKMDEYGSVQEFVDDFNLIISNVHLFNGPGHFITGQGLSMRSYFISMLQKVPSPSEQLPPKIGNKKHSPSVSQEPKRREPRAAAVVPPPPRAASPKESFALQSDGMPQIRRASSNARPARAIKPPQNREIPYAKPKRKEHLTELKFCEHLLDQIRSPRYASVNQIFQLPVDPVALNIPNYRQVIKTPMDLSTMSQKMKGGQYSTAAEFKKDFDLMIKNCLIFNPVGNPVRDIGIGMQREFELLWSGKDKWEKKNAPASTRASSASAEDSDEDADDEGPDPKAETITALQQQIAAMQSTLQELSGTGAPAKANAKARPKKNGNKKAAGHVAAPKPPKVANAKPKRQRLITYEEKDEISKAVERMDEKQIQHLTGIITRECPKYAEMEEMELEIDELPNDVQLMLLQYERSIFGHPKRAKNAARDYSPDDVAAQDDDDFEPRVRGGGAAAAAGGKKRKKHAPMNKTQQEEQLARLKDTLNEFSRAGSSASGSPAVHDATAQPESSGDDSESSEEE